MLISTKVNFRAGSKHRQVLPALQAAINVALVDLRAMASWIFALYSILSPLSRATIPVTNFDVIEVTCI